MTEYLISLAYILACVCAIMGIKKLGKVDTARNGMFIAAAGTAIAIVALFFSRELVDSFTAANLVQSGYFWGILGILIGSAIGLVWAKKVQMTGMPELVALFNGFGGLATAMIAFSEFLRSSAHVEFITPVVTSTATSLAIFIGMMTFTGSILAWGKLSEKITGQAIVFKGQKALNLLLLLIAVAAMTAYIVTAALGVDAQLQFLAVVAFTAIAFVFGFTFVLPIGGGDMPVVISLLNSLTGIALAMAGFMINSVILIVSGALVGASGIILTLIMCKAMNRSIGNLLFSGFGATSTAAKSGDGAEPKDISVENAYPILEAASSVVIIPGYGMAVAQAQHVVKELTEKLEEQGIEVNFAIHPVAGRMPGHMNVLLAEADIPYEQLKTMESINPSMSLTDVAIVIGANDVVNPVAETDPSSPIYGMPIIKAHEAKTVFVLKRGKGKGFSGIENELFTMPNTLMIYGDAKATISAMTEQFIED